MIKTPIQWVYVVDDDESVRLAIEDLLASVGLAVQGFESTHDFLAYPRPTVPSCLLLDVRMPGQSGMDFHRQMQDLGVRLPVIFMTGHGDIEMGVQAMKQGALDFFTKPFRDHDVLEAIYQALEYDAQRLKHEQAHARLVERWQSLTSAEQHVVHQVVAGLLSKQIAAELGLSEVTVKVRRASAMRKLELNHVVDLVRFMHALESDPKAYHTAKP
ncbi:MAG TPA: response regulator [Paenalcaligenes hominis]|uniref:Response regulator n=1 Tax=Paenalcaligenes hominis TaxID=643674 RepID=A0A9D3ABQ3_9BURK|nr:response regulator [Paenalcaligenes hominis]NJB64632.1 FixJ family two-component response regulator [Paenalcaligenes hominis]GGE60228.1 DNA-binding response regulator [Paenalcaligenes hominis]HJH24454.1 response regulator [Paenalcaligenes hominis]